MENNISVAIIDSDISYREIYMDCLKSLGSTVSISVSEPFRSLDFIMEKQPKLLIMDIVMPGYDSFKYIHTIREISPDTNIIIISYFMNECFEKMCSDLGVVEYLHKPIQTETLSLIFSQYIGLTHDIDHYKQKSYYSKVINDSLIDEILQNLNLPLHIKGSLYTKVAVKYMIKRNTAFESISVTKDIYPTVAKACNTTVSKVERSIRYCIEFILENETMDIISSEKYRVNDKGNYKISNSKFLIILENHVVRQLT